MRERLIELITNSCCVSTWNHYTDDFKEPNPIHELADYLLANGVIVLTQKMAEMNFDSGFISKQEFMKRFFIDENALKARERE